MKSQIIDHICVNVVNYEASKHFYNKVLQPLGIALVMEFGIFGGFGRENKPEFWIGEGKMDFQDQSQLQPISPIHVSFLAASREEVDEFYRAALLAGGKEGLKYQDMINYFYYAQIKSKDENTTKV